MEGSRDEIGAWSASDRTPPPLQPHSDLGPVPVACKLSFKTLCSTAVLSSADAGG